MDAEGISGARKAPDTSSESTSAGGDVARVRLGPARGSGPRGTLRAMPAARAATRRRWPVGAVLLALVMAGGGLAKRTEAEEEVKLAAQAGLRRAEGLEAGAPVRLARDAARAEARRARRRGAARATVTVTATVTAEVDAHVPTAAEEAPEADMQRWVTWDELAKHNNEGSAWLCISGKVYDVTSWLDAHPGGPVGPLSQAGKDASSTFFGTGHDWKNVERGQNLGYVSFVGNLEGYIPPSPPPPYVRPTHDAEGRPILYARIDIATTNLALIDRVRAVLNQRRDDISFVPPVTDEAPEDEGEKLPDNLDIPREEWQSHEHWSDCPQMPSLHVPLRVAVQQTIFHLASTRLDNDHHPVGKAYDTFRMGMLRVRAHVQLEEEKTFPALRKSVEGRRRARALLLWSTSSSASAAKGPLDGVVSHLVSDHSSLHAEDEAIERELARLADVESKIPLRTWRCWRGSNEVCTERPAVPLADVVALLKRLLAFDARFLRHLQAEEQAVVPLTLRHPSVCGVGAS